MVTCSLKTGQLDKIGGHMPNVMPEPSWFIEIHERLLKDDHAASADLANNLYSCLVQMLMNKKKTYRIKRNIELVYDAVADSIVAYIEKPEKYDPSRSGLITYLLISAENKMIDKIRKFIVEKNKSEKNVELETFISNILSEGKNLDRRLFYEEHYDIDQELKINIPAVLEFLYDNIMDREVCWLILWGIRDTHKYAQVLGLDPELMNRGMQQAYVRTYKVKVMAKLKRRGAEALEATGFKILNSDLIAKVPQKEDEQ